jgi:exocyst complex component 6
LIIPEILPLNNLFSVTQEIVGFFIIETHVLNTTGNFRSDRDVEELWDALLGRLSAAVDRALNKETDADAYLRVKEGLIAFVMTLEVCATTGMHEEFAITKFLTDLLVCDNEFALVYNCALRKICCTARKAIRKALRICPSMPLSVPHT